MTSAALLPNVNDGYALGTSSYSFSDLFLASGAVINFDNSDVTLTHSSGRLTLADSDKLVFGTGLDLQINHDATNSYVENFNGNLYIDNHHNDGDIIFRCDDGSGGVTTYFFLDGSASQVKFNVDVKLHDSDILRIGDSDDFKLFHSGTGSFVQNTTGNITFENQADDGDIIFQSAVITIKLFL